MRLLVVLLSGFLAACATAPPPEPPRWDAVPPGVVEALCRRLQSDALATGTLAIVRVTQPLATPENVAALEGAIDDGRTLRAEPPRVVNRAIPVSVGQGSCAWRPIDVRDAAGQDDQMIVEVSSPLMNPYNPREAGLFARASLGNEHPSWYWIALAPADEGWRIRTVSVLFK